MDLDPIDSFSSETDNPTSGLGVSNPGLSVGSSPRLGTVSLDDIVARGTQVQWDEAVAVVEALCDALMATGPMDPLVPPLQSILIGGDGTVTLKQGPRGERGALGAGRTLHALLSTANVPVALRLFVTQATTPESYPSLREFSTALAYFGKPLRVDLIRALYERHASGAAASVTPAPAVKPLAAPESELQPRVRKPLPPWIPVVAGVVVVVAAGAWLWSRAPGITTVGDVAPAPAITQPTGRPQPVRGGRPPAATAGNATRTATRPAAPEAAGPPSGRATGIVEPALLYGFQFLPPKLDPATSAGVAGDQEISSGTVSSETTANRQTVQVEDADRTPVTYSKADSDVRPPVLLYPQLPPPMPVDVRLDAVNSMEIVVSETGQVEQVRIVAGPRRMPDMMLLSGAKMWRFKPAVKDGQPVRYRTIVSWSGLP